MKLQVQVDGETRIIEVDNDCTLSQSLSDAGIELDLRCGGSGRCGKCHVELLSGRFELGNQEVQLPATVKACRCRPLGSEGRIRVSREASDRNRIATDTGFNLELDLSGEPGGLAVAVDIGTTTVATLLLDGDRVVSSTGMPNQQARFGDNVADRITHCQNSSVAQTQLHKAVVEETVNVLLRRLVTNPAGIERIAIAGNTVMTHLFYNEDPVSIGVAPFTPKYRIFPSVSADSLGVGICPSGRVLAVPAISGNVGGDIVAGLVASNFGSTGGTELLVDLGTNCEMVLQHRGKIWVTSAAAGPAFEGAELNFGCQAAPGVIEHVSILEPGEFSLSVVGGEKPVGLCGTGMVDFLAWGRRAGLLDEYGRLAWKSASRWNIGTMSDGTQGVYLSPDIAISELEIAELLKAKAAIGAGISTLLQYAGAKASELQAVYLCGGFARHLDLNSAWAIGMLPQLPPSVYRCCGNTSLAGATILAAHPDRLGEFESWVDRATEVPLNSLNGFELAYTDALLLA